jgi:MFS family permease
MTLATASLGGARAGANPWFVAAAVVVPTFMEVLDTTIAVVALRYIAGGLSATVDDGEWVITSYLVANAIILPITGWLSVRFGRRNYFLVSILIFTLASALCGMATSLNQLILFRVIQGLAGGGLQPSSQAALLDAFPAEKRGLECARSGNPRATCSGSQSRLASFLQGAARSGAEQRGDFGKCRAYRTFQPASGVAGLPSTAGFAQGPGKQHGDLPHP